MDMHTFLWVQAKRVKSIDLQRKFLAREHSRLLAVRVKMNKPRNSLREQLMWK